MGENLKSAEVEFPRTGRLTKWLFATVIILALIIGVVSTLVGVAYFTSATTCTTSKQSSEPEVTGSITVNSPEGSGTQEEELQYSVEENVAIYIDEDGLFSAMDYNKGLEIFNDPEKKDVCYLVPTEIESSKPSENRELFSELVASGKNVANSTTPEQETKKVLKGEIKDTSFLPTSVQERCDSTYWMIDWSDSDEEEHSIQKRSCVWKYRYYYRCYYRRRWYSYGRYLYPCYWSIRYRYFDCHYYA